MLHPVAIRKDAPPLEIPLFLEGLCAGFPSPADDHIDQCIDLSAFLIPNQAATYLWSVNGHSMKDAGIYDGDKLIVDRSLTARHGDIVVAIVNGERSVKRLLIEKGQPRLVCENREFPLYPLPDDGFEVWGVVTWNLHRHRVRR